MYLSSTCHVLVKYFATFAVLTRVKCKLEAPALTSQHISAHCGIRFSWRCGRSACPAPQNGQILTRKARRFLRFSLQIPSDSNAADFYKALWFMMHWYIWYAWLPLQIFAILALSHTYHTFPDASVWPVTSCCFALRQPGSFQVPWSCQSLWSCRREMHDLRGNRNKRGALLLM